MECNKDDALRAKEIAEKKMTLNDFEGAKKFALKAQNLYPDLENMNQLLSICNVHCSAQRTMVGSDKDWYGILQTEKYADELVVKKQYRKLALILHPDKNRFPGAEAAFKLICEANAVLSDPSKKAIYDSKIKAIVRSASVVPTPHQMNKNSQFSQQYGGQVKVSNAHNSMNQHQPKQTSFPMRQDTFWTACPYCSHKCAYLRIFVGRSLKCQKCQKSFTGHEIGNQAAHVRPTVSQPFGFQEKGAHTQGPYKVGVQNGQGFSAANAGFSAANAGFSAANVGFSAANASRQTAQPSVQTESIFKGKTEKVSVGGQVGKTSNGDANNRKKENLKNKRKRGGKFIVDSSESDDSTSESDSEEDVTILEKNLNSRPSESHSTRRSSRNRQNVSYNEADDDDSVILNSLKRSRGSKLSKGKQNDTLDGKSKKHGSDESKPESEETGGEEAEADETIEIESDSDAVAQYEETEFYDFEKDRDASCFAVNQLWACYDSYDGMPRFYAKIKKVSVSPFKMTFQWLEVDPSDEEQRKWFNEDLPVSCGRFKLGNTEKSSRQMFSHQVQCEKGKKRGSLIIQPKAGEVWAIFKDWDSSWSDEPDSHREYKYEVVEVHADFNTEVGSRVSYLTKIEGFISLFRKSGPSSIYSFMIRPNELYKFSHRVPCYETKGTEKEGVPAGHFELDPACLPPAADLYYPGK